LLIALGLAQAVETLHHCHPLAELHDSLGEDARKAIQHSAQVVAEESQRFQRLTLRAQQIKSAIDSHQTVAPPPPIQPGVAWDVLVARSPQRGAVILSMNSTARGCSSSQPRGLMICDGTLRLSLTSVVRLWHFNVGARKSVESKALCYAANSISVKSAPRNTLRLTEVRRNLSRRSEMDRC
jgi:hypothetical protein